MLVEQSEGDLHGVSRSGLRVKEFHRSLGFTGAVNTVVLKIKSTTIITLHHRHCHRRLLITDTKSGNGKVIRPKRYH